ncbi:MAG: hypothetical protein ACM33C_00110 [Syntrophaceae bacterium]
MNENEEKLLKARQEKMMEIVRGLPSGTFRYYKGAGTGIERFLETHVMNIRDVGKRIGKAKRAGCYIETISLRLQIIDFWLRIFFVNRAAIGQKRRWMFDELLEQCRNIGLKDDLYRKIMSFNSNRIDAIQGFLTGKMKYDDLASVDKSSEATAIEVVEYVLVNCGEIFDGTTPKPKSSDRGDMILNVPNFLKEMPIWIAGT